jgi:TetR/AcrR family transcriptional repressor of uid operon
MSIHSHEQPVSLPVSTSRLTADERRRRILDAAEACFVRNGFHRTTMNDVAAEAGMSAGNLYRYFASKEAIVRGLTERDRELVIADFEAASSDPDILGAIEAIGRRHLADEPREKAILVLEIWSEATRNPEIFQFCGAIDDAVRQHLAAMLDKAQREGLIAPEVDVPQAVQMLYTLAEGLLKRRALEPAFDGEAAIAMLSAFMRSVLRPALALPRPDNTP